MRIEQFRQIYDEWKQSGLSVQQYCENTGLSESRFYCWKAKLKADMLPAACGSFIPVKMSGKPASYSARGARTSALCEVAYPNGVIVRVTSDMTLDQLRPLYYQLQDYMLHLDYLQSDESTVPVINNEKHRAVKGYMWLVRAITEPLVLFHYHEGSRGKEVALQFFAKFKGALGVDGYGVYDLLQTGRSRCP